MKTGKKLFSLVLAGALFLQVGLPAAQAAGEQSQAQQYAQQVAYQTEAEGIVLLKNKNNCLPLEGVWSGICQAVLWRRRLWANR